MLFICFLYDFHMFLISSFFVTEMSRILEFWHEVFFSMVKFSYYIGLQHRWTFLIHVLDFNFYLIVII